jgi:hypothetical protein
MPEMPKMQITVELVVVATSKVTAIVAVLHVAISIRCTGMKKTYKNCKAKYNVI